MKVFPISRLARAITGALGLLAVLLPSTAYPQIQPRNHSDEEILRPVDRSDISKIAQFTATEHGSILFAIADHGLMYASNGTVRDLKLLSGGSRCSSPFAAFSHDGRTIAYWSAQPSGNCGITLLDVATGSSRPLLDLSPGQRALSWSWDDSEVAYVLSAPLASIQAVSVRDGSVHTLLPPTHITVNGVQYSGRNLDFYEWDPVQWSHAGNILVLGITWLVPNSHSLWFNTRPGIAIASHGALAVVPDGRNASISPVEDRVAFFAANGNVVSVRLDGSDLRTLSKRPSWMGILPDVLTGPLTWSPDGKQLFFGDVVSETCSDDVFLLQVDTGVRRRFLQHSCVSILDWR